MRGVDELGLQAEPLGLLPALVLCAGALRHVAHDGDDQQIILGSQRAQAHLDGKLAAILPQSEKFQIGSHWPCMGSGSVARPMLLVNEMDMRERQCCPTARHFTSRWMSFSRYNRPPGLMVAGGQYEAELLHEGTIYLGLLAPLAHPDVVAMVAQRQITSYALDYVPRLSRAQSMDALTSMATVAGYQAVVVAAERLGKMFPLLMTAGGTVSPAGVLVLGAGVAGLQAIATARRLGAKVAAFVEMEVTEDLETAGGYAAEASSRFLEQEREAIRGQLPQTDVALIIGANDVVNPAARYKKESLLCGMPILDADKAHTVMVLKRSLRPGFAGEDIELFYQPKTIMVFGDAKATLTSLVQLIKQTERPSSGLRRGAKDASSPLPREYQTSGAAQ